MTSGLGRKTQAGKKSSRTIKKKKPTVLSRRPRRAASRLAKLALAGGSGMAVQLCHQPRKRSCLSVCVVVISCDSQDLSAEYCSGETVSLIVAGTSSVMRKKRLPSSPEGYGSVHLPDQARMAPGS